MSLKPLRGQFDLTQARSALAGWDEYADLVKLIERCTHHQSVAEDLRIGVTTLDTLIKLGPGGPDAVLEEGDDLVRQSLFVNVVMLYCRATHSQDGGRPFKGGVEKGYSDAQRAAHKRVTHLRDKVVAHHGAASDQDWTDDRLILNIGDGEMGFRSVFERKLLTRAALADLRALLPTAFAWVGARYSTLEAQLVELLLDRVRTEPALYDAIKASRFDPEAYFGPGPLADAFDRGGETGDVAAHIRWTRSRDHEPTAQDVD